MLPFCSDEVLLRELGVLVNTGWELPDRRQREGQVAHLLLLGDEEDGARYRQRAQRLLDRIDAALRRAEDEEQLISDDALGLRILLGLEPGWRTTASPVERREAAATYLVPAWQQEPPAWPAATFQRRHQDRALRQVLSTLRWAYGQETDLPNRHEEQLTVRRWYVVDAARRVVLLGDEELLRARHDDYDVYTFLEESDEGHGIAETRFRVLANKIGPAVGLWGIKDSPHYSSKQDVALLLAEKLPTGQQFSVCWEKELIYAPDADWENFSVGIQVTNDGVDMEMSVAFLDEQPAGVWWYCLNPEADVTFDELADDHSVEVDAEGVARRRWSETERRMAYGLQWLWTTD